MSCMRRTLGCASRGALCGGRLRRRRSAGARAFHQGTMVQLALENACEHTPAPAWARVISPVATPAHAGLVSCSAQVLPGAQAAACATTSRRPPRWPATTVSCRCVCEAM